MVDVLFSGYGQEHDTETLKSHVLWIQFVYRTYTYRTIMADGFIHKESGCCCNTHHLPFI